MTDQSPTGLPPSLERFQSQLEAAARRDVKRSSRLRPTLIRATAVGVTVAAAVAVLSVVGVFGKNGPSLVDNAAAIDRAAAALAPHNDAILHIDMLGSQKNADGSVDTWSDESWQSGTKPYDRRQVETGTEGAGSRVETAMVDGRTQVYDPSTDTIYVDTQAKPADTTASSSSAARAQQQHPTYPRMVSVAAASGGKVKVTIETKAGDGSVTRTVQVVKKVDLKRLTTKLAIASGASTSDSGSASASTSPADSGQDPFRAEILALLQSGKVRENGRPTIDGRDLIRFVSNDGHATYLVDAATYDPVEWQTKGDGGGTTLRFVTYEQLSVSDGSALLSLTAQHPGARVDRDPAHVAEATGRLFPNG